MNSSCLLIPGMATTAKLSANSFIASGVASQSISFSAAAIFLVVFLMPLASRAQPLGRKHDVDRRTGLLGRHGTVFERDADRKFARPGLLAGLRPGVRVDAD